MSRRIRIEKEMLRKDIERYDREWRHVMSHQRHLQDEQTRIEAILCNLRNRMMILCNQENASETPVEASNEGGATNQPQNAKEGR